MRKNMPPRVWGGHGWRTLYRLAQAYSPGAAEHRAALLQSFQALPHMLPCTSCRVNVQKELQDMPPLGALASSAAALQYVNRLHNSVSARLGKPQQTLAQLGLLKDDDGMTALWDFLVAVAYAYPPAPTAEEAHAARGLLRGIAVLLQPSTLLAEEAHAADGTSLDAAVASQEGLAQHVQRVRNAALGTTDTFDAMVAAVFAKKPPPAAAAPAAVGAPGAPSPAAAWVAGGVALLALLLIIVIILVLCHKKRRLRLQ
jgi:hypothetical protein